MNVEQRAGGGTRGFRLYAALAFSFAWVPVMYTAFVVRRGFSPDEYARLWAVYYTVMVLAELPWGWVADRLGKRPLLVAGPLLLAAAFVLLGRAQQLGTCLFAMGLTGAAHAMISGADSAWLYEWLVGQGRRRDALREESAAHRWRLLGVSAADLSGGILAATVSVAAAFDLAAVLMLLAAAVGLRLPAARPGADTGNRLRPNSHVGTGLRAGPASEAGHPGAVLPRLLSDLRREGVLWCLAWFGVVFVLLRVGFQLYQPTLLEHGVDDLVIHGAVFSALNLLAGLAALLVAPVFSRLGEKGSALMVLVLLGCAFIGLALGGPALLLPLLAMQQVSFSFLQPLGRTMLNHRIPSGDRAALLSAQSVVGRLGFAALLFVVDGDLAVTHLGSTYSVLALATLGLGLLLLARAPRPARGQQP